MITKGYTHPPGMHPGQDQVIYLLGSKGKGEMPVRNEHAKNGSYHKDFFIPFHFYTVELSG